MRDKVPGMSVKDEYIDRMAGAVAGIAKEEKKARREAWQMLSQRAVAVASLTAFQLLAGVHGTVVFMAGSVRVDIGESQQYRCCRCRV